MERQAKERWIQRWSEMTIFELETRISNNGVTNLSRTHLTNTQLEVLGHNLKFIPSRNILDYSEKQLVEDWDRFKYRTFFKAFYIEEQSSTRPSLYVPNPNQSYNTINHTFYEASNPFHYSLAKNMSTSPLLSSTIEHPTLRKRFNLNHQQRMTMKSLLSDATLTFKPADKNLGLVVLDTDFYNQTVEAILSDTSTYKLSTKGEMNLAMRNYSAFLKSIPLGEDLRTFTEQWNIRRKVIIPSIYFMPKIHKTPLAWRPIIPSHSWMTTSISIIVDSLLSSTVKAHTIGNSASTADPPTIIKDSKSLINVIRNLRINDPDCWFITSDISNLYTNIPSDSGPAIVADMVPNHSTLLKTLLRKILHNNFFEFNGQTYLQINGTAMGTNCAPNYANLYLVRFELPFINEFKESIIFYGRFLDDILIIFDSRFNLERFKESFLQMNPHLKFSFNTSQQEMEFLDIIFYKGPDFTRTGVLDTRLHQKSCNRYLYLPYRSQHATHTKTAMIITELKRYIRISSTLREYMVIRQLFYLRLCSRGFKPSFLLPIFNSIFYDIRSKLLDEKVVLKHDEKDYIFFSMEFNESTKQFSHLLRRRLHQWKERQESILNALEYPSFQPMISWKSAPNFFKLFTTNARLKYLDRDRPQREHEEKSSPLRASVNPI